MDLELARRRFLYQSLTGVGGIALWELEERAKIQGLPLASCASPNCAL